MARLDPVTERGDLLGRVRALILRPSAAWETIAREPARPSELFRRVVAPLAAISAVCGALGVTIFGVGFFGVGLRPPFGAAFAEMVASFALTLVAVYLVALTAEMLAPRFGGQRDHGRAVQLAAYSGAPYWVAGVFQLYPPIGWLAATLGGLWSLYLLYLGLPRLLEVREESRITAFAVLLLIMLTIGVSLGAIGSAIRDLGGPLTLATA